MPDSASVKVRPLCSTVVEVKYSGLLTFARLSELQDSARQDVIGASAIVVDFNAATVALSVEELWGMAKRHCDAMTFLPTAIVADDVARPIFARVAMLEALAYRRERFLTDSPAKAAAWALSLALATHLDLEALHQRS